MKELNDFIRQLEQAQKAIARLDGPLTQVQFDPDQPGSINAAIGKMEAEIDRILAPYRNNPFVAELADGAKEQFAEELRERAAKARSGRKDGADDMDTTIFRRIENTVDDLKWADMQSFGRHVKKLSQLLHSEELEPITGELAALVDLPAWLEAGKATQGSMIGSASLDWPTDRREELGMNIALIDYFAEDPDRAWDFAHTFFYTGGKVTPELQNLAAQVVVPFARDFIDFVKEETGSGEPAQLPVRDVSASRKVFVVHGHDEAAKESVARFLERIGFEAIILHEQASQGMTVIEKIEAHGDVGFAVVLLTPDDTGGKEGADAAPRARQNVILELGYFIGRLGRARVTALRRGDVEVPSDFGGVVYEVFDAGGGWKQALAKELTAAGFEIDWNMVMK